MTPVARFFPWVCVGIVALYFSTRLVPPSTPSDQANVHAFGDITVQDGGRYKPIDTIARTRLLSLAHKQSITPEEDLPKITADRWLLDVLAKALSTEYQMVTITNPETLALLELKKSQDDRYSVYEFEAKFNEIGTKAMAAHKKDADKRMPLDYDVWRLAVTIAKRLPKAEAMAKGIKSQNIDPDKIPFFRIENDAVIAMLGLLPRPGFRYSFDEIRGKERKAVLADAGQDKYFMQFLKNAARVGMARERGEQIKDVVDIKTLELYQHLRSYYDLGNLNRTPGMIPVPEGKWLTLGQALEEMEAGQEVPEAETLTNILYAYAVNDPATFNKEVANYRQLLARSYPAETQKSNLELFFNDFDPFYLCAIFYVVVLVLSVLSWFPWPATWSEVLRRTAFSMAVLVVFIHTWALGTRMYIMGRPPVTNLYSSAIFIGWGCVLLCLVLEWIFHNGFGNLIASVLGSLTLLLAIHGLDTGETMEVLVAVLDTNFWLATHVVCVTLGYTATLVAGTMGAVFILVGLLTSRFNKAELKTLANMIYGVVCFATLLSFVGTVLGGIWADQSWGRFWGWDPKENGAVLIVIWNALTLHARWGGLVKERGMAMLSVFGSMVVGWSWFGTNQLSVGLHNYGFSKSLAEMLVWGWGAHLAIILAGLIPVRYWKGYNIPGPGEIPSPIPSASSRKGGGRHLRPARA